MSPPVSFDQNLQAPAGGVYADGMCLPEEDVSLREASATKQSLGSKGESQTRAAADHQKFTSVIAGTSRSSSVAKPDPAKIARARGFEMTANVLDFSRKLSPDQLVCKEDQDATLALLDHLPIGDFETLPTPSLLKGHLAPLQGLKVATLTLPEDLEVKQAGLGIGIAIIALITLLIEACGDGAEGSTETVNTGPCPNGSNLKHVYPDFDGDGAVDSFPEKKKTVCNIPDGYGNGQHDCDDDDPKINPNAKEICSDKKDNDCDGTTDEENCTSNPCDLDADGYLHPKCGGNDCNDDVTYIHPETNDACNISGKGNGIDEDCDGQTDEECTINIDCTAPANKEVEYACHCDPDGNGLIDDDQIPDDILRSSIKKALALDKDDGISIQAAKAMLSLWHAGYFFNKPISKLNGIECFPNLTDLRLPENDISDVKPIEGLVKLDYLDLSYNQISDVGPISGLINLNFLWLGDNQIINIAPLTNLIKLEKLGLFSNQISDVAPLVGLKGLKEFIIGGNQINDIEPLVNLPNLETLSLATNQISNVAPLAGLIHLRDLSLSHNLIGDITGLLQNPGLNEFAEVDLYGNPQIPSAQIQQLCDKGPLVYYNNTYCNF